MFAKKIGIDLGTATMRVYVRGEGITMHEPALAAVEPRSGNLLAVGYEARQLAAQAPRQVRLVRPLQDAAIVHADVVARLLQHLVTRAQGRQRLFRPEVMMCVASASAGSDRRVLTEAAIAAGARQAWLIEAPLAAALGLGLPVADSQPHVICDVGAGSVEVAVIAESGVVVVVSEPSGGDALDRLIAAAVHDRHGVELDGEAAEAVKLAVASALPQDPPLAAEAAGTGLDGSPRAATVTSADVDEAVRSWLRSVAGAVERVVGQTPARLRDAARRRGVHLTGGGALLRGLAPALEQELGMPFQVGEDPGTCAVRGTRRALGEFEVVQRRQLYLR